jgi:CPA1 family monovalent cation:H+ antiporter
LPTNFPARDLIVLTAFSVVLGTLLLQGLTLKVLLRALKLHDGDPVANEVHAAREAALKAALTQLPRGASPAIDLVRENLRVRLGTSDRTNDRSAPSTAEYDAAYRAALQSARQTILAMRDSGAIGDDAFHTLENDLDWMEASDPLRAANADETQEPATR